MAPEEESAMPTYEYRCRKCGEVFDCVEHVEQHQTPGHLRCPKCNSDEVEPVVTPFFTKTSKKS
jgi:putative FmdB family regulatory protein